MRTSAEYVRALFLCCIIGWQDHQNNPDARHRADFHIRGNSTRVLAEDGRIASEMATLCNPGYYDSIPMDIQMPGTDG